MRVAVLSKEKLQVFHGRSEVAAFEIGDNLTASDVEQARVASYAPMRPIVRFSRFGLPSQPSPYNYGAA